MGSVGLGLFVQDCLLIIYLFSSWKLFNLQRVDTQSVPQPNHHAGFETLVTPKSMKMGAKFSLYLCT